MDYENEKLWDSSFNEDSSYLRVTPSNIFKRVDELEGANSKPVSVVNNLIRTKTLTSILGSSKIGKSQLALEMAFCIQNGIKFLNYDTTESDVIYVDFEHQDHELLERINKLRTHYGLKNGKSPYILTIDGNEIYNEESLVEICDQCRVFIQHHPTVRLVIFDSFSSFVPGDYNDPVNAKSYLDILKYLSRDKRDIAVAYTQSSSKTSPGNAEDIIYSSGGNGIHRKLSDVTITIARKNNQPGFYTLNILNGKRTELTCEYNKNTNYVFDFNRKEGEF